MHYPTVHDAISRVRLHQLDSGKWTLLFRNHYSTPRSIIGSEVPSLRPAGTDDVFYFCGKFAFPIKKYYTFLAETYADSDYEVLHHGDSQWSAEMCAIAYEIQGMAHRDSAPVPRSTLLSLRDECIKKKLAKGATNADVCALFYISERYISKLTDQVVAESDVDKPHKKPAEKVAKAAEYNRKYKEDKEGMHLRSDPRYNDLRGMIAYARTRASNIGVYGKYAPLDVLPNMNSMHGNVGAHNSIRFIPSVCPVLRIPLTWGRSNDMLSAPRVWRKTNTKPFGPDNVTIMSKQATWLVEGAYGKNRVNDAMDHAMREAWEDWQARHPTLCGRRGKTGRPDIRSALSLKRRLSMNGANNANGANSMNNFIWYLTDAVWFGTGYGDGDGNGYSYGGDYGGGNSYGNGYSYGYSYGSGNSYGYGDRYSYGNRYGNGYGNGYGDE